jgi:hypothetical protein
VSDFVAFGLPGVNLERGDHICAFHFGEPERDEIVLPYLGAGLAAGDALRTHPKLLLGGMIIENPPHLTPNEFRALRR